MSTKYFGEFLVHKGIISARDLVEALIEQIRIQPPLCQLAYEEKLLSPESMVEVFRVQQDLGLDFMSACKKLGVSNNEFGDKIEAALNKVRTPLGQLLVGKGALDIKTLTRMLDEFLSQCEVHTPAPVQAPNVEHVTANVTDEIFSEQESQEFPELGSGIIMELEEVFDERKHKVIRVAMAFVKDKAAVDPDAVSKLFRDSLKVIHTINGLLRLFGIERLGKLMNSLEKVIEVHLKKEASSSQHQHIADLIYRSFEEAWRVRVSIIRNQTEKDYFLDSSNNTSFENTINELNGALKND